MTGHLEPIVYEKVPHGWRVPDHERERWNNPPKTTRPRTPGGEARPVQQLVVELDAWVFLSDTLETTLRAAHAANPVRTTRLVEKVTVGAQDQTLRNPEGYLAKHAAQLAT